MRIVFSYLSQLEVTKMQQGNQFLYNRAVSRCQVSINLQQPIFFFRDSSARNKIYMLDVSAYRLHERTLSEDFGANGDWRSQVISFRGGAYITGGELDRKRCVKISFVLGANIATNL